MPWWIVALLTEAELRCATMAPTTQCVMKDGTTMMQLLYVTILDTAQAISVSNSLKNSRSSIILLIKHRG